MTKKHVKDTHKTNLAPWAEKDLYRTSYVKQAQSIGKLSITFCTPKRSVDCSQTQRKEGHKTNPTRRPVLPSWRGDNGRAIWKYSTVSPALAKELLSWKLLAIVAAAAAGLLLYVHPKHWHHRNHRKGTAHHIRVQCDSSLVPATEAEYWSWPASYYPYTGCPFAGRSARYTIRKLPLKYSSFTLLRFVITPGSSGQYSREPIICRISCPAPFLLCCSKEL